MKKSPPYKHYFVFENAHSTIGDVASVGAAAGHDVVAMNGSVVLHCTVIIYQMVVLGSTAHCTAWLRSCLYHISPVLSGLGRLEDTAISQIASSKKHYNFISCY